MAAGKTLYAKEDRRRLSGAGVDIPFLVLVLLLLTVGLTMLYSVAPPKVSMTQAIPFPQNTCKNRQFVRLWA